MKNFFAKFFNFKKDKEFYCCKCLENTIVLHRNWYGICSMYAHPNYIYRPLYKWTNDKIDYKNFLEFKRKIVEGHKKGHIYKACIGCDDLEKRHWTGKIDKFYHVHFRLATRCNAKCIYCTDQIDNTSEDRLFLNQLKELVRKNIIDKNALIEMGGGEFTIHKEFDQIFRFLLDNGYRRYKIFTSCLRHSKEIEEALSYGKTELIVSPDAGDRETFIKIKQADTYNLLWGNLEKYINAQNENKSQVRIKMIMIKGLNDSDEHIDAFLAKIKSIGGNFAIFDFETDTSVNLQKSNNLDEIRYLFNRLKKAIELTENKYDLQYDTHLNIRTLTNKYPEIYKEVFN